MRTLILILLFINIIDANSNNYNNYSFSTDSPSDAVAHIFIPTLFTLIFTNKSYDYNKFQTKENKKLKLTLPTTFPYADMIAK